MIAVFKFRCLVNANVSVSTKIHIDDTPIPIRLQGVNRKGIKIGNDCWIGAKATILDSVMISDSCVVVVGALVTRGVYPPYSIIGGVLAGVIKKKMMEKESKLFRLYTLCIFFSFLGCDVSMVYVG